MPQPPPPNATAPTAFITGASSGIGRAIAEKLLAENYRVWGTSRDPARLAALAQKFPATFTPVALDLDNPDAAQTAYEQAAAGLRTEVASGKWQVAGNTAPQSGAGSLDTLATCHLPLATSPRSGSFDIVINNAGYGLFSPFADADFAVWQRQLDAMLVTTARLAHAALRDMIACNHGTLVNVSSLAVNFPLPYMSAYNIAKAGISALSESLIFETRGTNVVVIDFRPGDYRTAFNDIMRPDATAATAAAAATGATNPDSGLRTPDAGRRSGLGDTPDSTNPPRPPAPAAEPPLASPSALQPFSPSALSTVWRTLDTQFNTAPLPDRAARDLLRAIARGRSGTVCSGRFFQARLAPIAARFLPATLMRSLQARYFGAT